MSAKKGAQTVADYLIAQLEVCGKSQKQIASELGYTKPNIITMFKLGQTKIPVEKVPAFAKAIGVDPTYFMRLVMQEYMPETWRAIRDTLGEPLTEHESELVKVYRDIAKGRDLAIDKDILADIKALLRKKV